jgi:hypothetical protein
MVAYLYEVTDGLDAAFIHSSRRIRQVSDRTDRIRPDELRVNDDHRLPTPCPESAPDGRRGWDESPRPARGLAIILYRCFAASGASGAGVVLEIGCRARLRCSS